MRIAKVALDRRLVRFAETDVPVVISATLEEDLDADLGHLRQAVDFGDRRQNEAYLAKFESGELISLNVRVTAAVVLGGVEASGEASLPGVHLPLFDYEDHTSADLRGQLLELLEFHDLIADALEDLTEKIRKKKVKISHRKSGQKVAVTAAAENGALVGYAYFTLAGGTLEADDSDGADSLWVHPLYRRRGVASIMYDIAEKNFAPVIPSEHLSGAGQKFWDARLNTLPDDHPARDYL